MPFDEPQGAFANLFVGGWNRLEARSRHDDFALGLEARLADPLWALGRQWQMRELEGRDGGSPIHVELEYEEARVDRVALGDQAFEEIGSTPIEVLVEREAVPWDWRLRVRAGQHFERLARLEPTLISAGVTGLLDAVQDEYPIVAPERYSDEWVEMDFATQRFVALMAGHAIDGGALYEAISGGTAPAVIPQILRDKFLAWYAALYSQAPGAPPAWNSEQLEYSFSLQTENSTSAVLRAPSYRNGSFDWDSLVVEKPEQIAFETKEPLQLTPVHVAFPGQPRNRWWEFEDGAMDFGALDVAKSDLGKLVLIEYALVFGDAFVVPLTAAPNTLVRIRSLRVRDSFGQYTKLDPARDLGSSESDTWNVFSLAHAQDGQPPGDFLYVPPPSGFREESPPLEEVRFARDEDANTVWAIEQTVSNQLGNPTAGFTTHLERRRRWRERVTTTPTIEPTPSLAEEPTPEGESLLSPVIAFRLSTTVPSNWVPYIASGALNAPAGIPQRSVKLQRAAMTSTGEMDQQLRVLSLSRVLRSGDSTRNVTWIREDVVGRDGARIELHSQRTRLSNGETVVWLGRKCAPGRGEARSRLRFDTVGPSLRPFKLE